MVPTKLPSALIKLWTNQNATYKSTGKTFKKPYAPFITVLSNLLVDQAKKYPFIATLLAGNTNAHLIRNRRTTMDGISDWRPEGNEHQ